MTNTKIIADCKNRRIFADFKIFKSENNPIKKMDIIKIRCNENVFKNIKQQIDNRNIPPDNGIDLTEANF